MQSKALDLTKILKPEHQNKWVLYSPSKMEVVACDKDLEKTINKAKSSNINDLVLHKVLPFDAAFAPSSSAS